MRFPLASVMGVASGFFATVLLAHLLPYDPTDELPATSIAPEPHASIRALSSARAASERRVFFIGASMTAGYPYKDGCASYARQMKAGLAAVYGHENVFVHDYAKPALDSRELVRLVDRVLADYDPSCICVTLGSNEFANRIFSGKALLPANIVDRVGEHASRARLALRTLPTSRSADEEARQKELRDRLDFAENGKPLFGALPVEPADAELLTQRMRRMMQRMSEACAAKGVPLVFVVAVYGLGGFWPWGISGDALPEIDELVREAWRPLDEARARTLRPRVEALLADHPGRADLHFLYGMVLRSCGDEAVAREHFERARDLDTVPMHQTGMVRAAILAEAETLERPCLVLDEAFYEQGALLPDTRDFLDYGHLSDAGARRAAAWLSVRLAALGHVPALPTGWEQRFANAAAAYVERTTTALELATAVPGIAASNANFSMMFGNFRDAVPWLAKSVPGYLRHPELAAKTDQKWHLVLCLYQLSGRYEETLELPPKERVALLGDLDRQINEAVLEDRLDAWILDQLGRKAKTQRR